MNIHSTLGVVFTLTVFSVFLAGIGWVYARICRTLARSQGFSVVATVTLAGIITGVFYLWLGFFGFTVLLTLIPAWLLERRPFRCAPANLPEQKLGRRDQSEGLADRAKGRVE
jgi:hypothetical protein